MKRISVTLIFLLLIALVWELLVRMGIWNHVLLPAPSDILLYYKDSILDGTLLEACLVTVKRLLVGYAVGIAVGIPLGLLNARYTLCKDTIGTIGVGFQILPSICWAPLALIWFGQNEFAMFFIVLMGSVWSIAIATETGVRGVPPIYIRAARTMGSKGLHTWIHVILPASFPHIVSGMKLGWAFSWRSLMAAEIYVTILTGFGLGSLLHYGRELHAMEQVFGVMIVIMCIGLLIDKLLFTPIEHYIYQKWGIDRANGV